MAAKAPKTMAVSPVKDMKAMEMHNAAMDKMMKKGKK